MVKPASARCVVGSTYVRPRPPPCHVRPDRRGAGGRRGACRCVRGGGSRAACRALSRRRGLRCSKRAARPSRPSGTRHRAAASAVPPPGAIPRGWPVRWRDEAGAHTAIACPRGHHLAIDVSPGWQPVVTGVAVVGELHQEPEGGGRRHPKDGRGVRPGANGGGEAVLDPVAHRGLLVAWYKRLVQPARQAPRCRMFSRLS